MQAIKDEEFKKIEDAEDEANTQLAPCPPSLTLAHMSEENMGERHTYEAYPIAFGHQKLILGVAQSINNGAKIEQTSVIGWLWVPLGLPLDPLGLPMGPRREKGAKALLRWSPEGTPKGVFF